ncbi:uncharacterized protein LOC131428762 [Malaya genurostris]|uniref:uncharacterized protein LOC131428762 n=1 Tax=Malaya genurostris TaxID=325434 RepID=UPI0026F3E12A|nr:uncharacterized protein LOC131428762 [Malaya genurostris]
MASSRFTFDQASELLMGWYYNLKVEFLADDELDHELTVRSVIIGESLDRTRKRLWLRDQLRSERGKSADKILPHVPVDPTKEISVCSQKYSELKAAIEQEENDDAKKCYYTRLLHVGVRIVTILSDARGSPNLHSFLQNTVVELTEIIFSNFDDPLNLGKDNEPLDGENADVGNTVGDALDTNDELENNDRGCVNHPRQSVLSQGDIDWIHSLQARIVDLEQELNQRKNVKHAGTQTSNHFVKPSNNQPNKNQNFSLSSFSYPSFQNPSLPLSNCPRLQEAPQNTATNQPTTPLDNPIEDALPTPSFPHYNTPTIPNHRFANANTASFQNRHTLPVSKWNITKYSGDDQGLKLNEFLELVQALSQAEHVSETELFESAVHLFTGSALKWYMTQRTTGRLLNWQHLIFELKRTYMHPDLDALIKMKIYQRRQQKHESFHEYYFELEKLFRTMSIQIPEYEKVQIIQQNMRIDYKRQMTFIPIVNLETLVAAGQKLDALNFSAYNKVFGTEKFIQAIDGNEANTKKKSKTQPQAQQKGQTAAVVQQPNQLRNQSNTSSNTQNNQSRSNYQSIQSKQPTQNHQSNQNSSHDSVTQIPVAGPSQSQPRPQITLEDVINAHSPPPINTCFNCGRIGHHFAITCEPKSPFAWSRRVTTKKDLPTVPPPFWIDANDSKYPESSETFQIIYPFPNDNRPYASVKVYGFPIRALLDSGSNHTLISDKLFAQLKYKKLEGPPKKVLLRSASGDELRIIGQAHLPFSFGGSVRVIPTLVVENISINCICGMDFWKKFQIHPAMQELGNNEHQATVSDYDLPASESYLSDEQKEEIKKIKRLFLPAREGELTLTNGAQHRIVLADEWANKPPVRQFPYVMSPKTQELVAVELQRLLNLGVIERSCSDWSLNCVPVIKPNKVRLCLDARKINERTVRDAYPLPHPGRILGQLPKARYFSTIDLSEAFLQVPLEVESRKYTAFSVQGRGLFQYTRMPFGLANSPATLARLMDKVLGHGILEPYVFVYLDDIVVVTETFAHHQQLLTEIACRLQAANLSINLEKSKFGVTEIPFLGYLLSTDGLRANPDKIRPIVEYERPNTITKLRRFLGMANYYRRFIPNFSGVTAALSDLLQSKTKTIRWNDEAETAFCNLKECLISSPVLGSPDFSPEFTIQTDASDVAVAGVLTQEQDGVERVISYYSKKLTTPQKNYHAAEKEALAAILSVDAFRGYIEGYHFTLVTDSSALTHILSSKWKVGSRCSRWALNLQQFNMTVRHRKGKENIVPDALSRSIAAVSDSSWYTSMKRKVLDRPDDFVNFKVENQKLYKFVTSHNDYYDSRFEWKVIPPPSEVGQILEQCHDECFHPGFERTLARVRQRFYWPKMAVEVRRYIQKCTTCKEVKASSAPTAPEMGKIKLATHPWQIISVDFIGPLPRSRRGNQHLLVVCDYFSKWVMLQPMKSVSSVPMCNALRDQWFLKNSVPEVIITDNGSSFISKDFKGLLDRFGVTHWLNSRYHSQSNPVERVNRTINAAIRTYVREDQRLWDTRIPEIEMVLNTSVHASTGFTPFFITLGLEFTESGSDNKLARQNEQLTPEQINERRKRMFPRIFDMVAKNLQKAHNASQYRYNLRHRRFSKSFVEGQLVYHRNMKLSNATKNYNAKYGRQFIPCRVKAKIGSSSYELEDLNGKSLGIWPAIHLKPG